MIDLVQIQKDLTLLLLGSDQLQTINVVNYREKRIQNEVDGRVLLNGRGQSGAVGAGVLVLMPVAASDQQNVAGPVLDWEFPIIVVEQPTINFTPGQGTMLDAESIGQMVMDVLHHHADDLFGTFKVSGRPMAMDRMWMQIFPDCIAYRVTLSLMKGKNLQTPRVGPVSIAFVNGSAVLSCPTAGARIKYTLDGSSPSGDIAGNSSSIIYNGPFPVNSGDEIRAGAYLIGMNHSAWRWAIAP